MMTIIVATADDQPPTATEIARELKMPRTTVVHRIDELVAAGLIRRGIGTSYVANMEALDALVTREWFAEVETASTLAQLRPARRRWRRRESVEVHF